jgi:tetratricopeptide (TPR) repeat protein
MKDAEEAIRLAPKSGQGYTIRGFVWLHRGDVGKAIQECTVALGLDPNLPEAYFARAAAAHLGNQGLDQAIRDCDQAIRLAPQWGAAYRLRASLHLKTGEEERAYPDLEKAAELDPQDADFRAYMSELHAHRHRDEKVIEHVSAALKLKKWPAAREAQLRERRAQAFLRRGQEQSDSGNRQLAIQTWTEGLRLDPQAADLHYTLGCFYAAGKNARRAVEHLDLAIASGGLSSVQEADAVQKRKALAQ